MRGDQCLIKNDISSLFISVYKNNLVREILIINLNKSSKIISSYFIRSYNNFYNYFWICQKYDIIKI